MSTADEFLELQRLLAGIKSISTKLESIRAHGMTPRARVGVECDDFMNHVETKSDTTETTAFDPVEKRLYVATLLDTLRRCKVLHATNEAMIVAAEKRMISLGCTAPLTSAACPISNSSFSAIARNHAIYESTLKSLGSPPLCYVDVDAVDSTVMTDYPGGSHEILNACNIDVESYTFQSPAVIRTPYSKGSEHEVRTPALPDWNLSEATRILVQKGDPIEFISKNKAQPLQHNFSASYQCQGRLDGDAIHTPVTLDLTCSSMAQIRHTSNRNTKNFNGTIMHLESDMLTPQPVVRTACKRQTEIKSCDSPTTPNLGTPFHTTHLRNAATTTANNFLPLKSADLQKNVSRTLVLSPDADVSPDKIDRSSMAILTPAVEMALVHSTVDSPLMSTPCMMRDDYNWQMLDSPPSPAESDLQPILLQLSPSSSPVKKGALSMVSLSDGRSSLISISISPVTAVEWESAPAFLRKQVRT